MDKQSNMHEVTPEQLTMLARQHVNDKMLDGAIKDPYFREFLRVFTFININAVEGIRQSDQESYFAHTLGMENHLGDLVNLVIKVSVKPTLMGPANLGKDEAPN